MGTLTIITPPITEPVTLEEVKSALRVDDPVDDIYLSSLITGARQWAEQYLNQYLPEQVIELSYPRVPAWHIPLGAYPIQSVDSVKYFDTASPSAEITLVADDQYHIDTKLPGGEIELLTWPNAAIKPNTLRIRMTVGYPVDSNSGLSTVPEIMKEGIKTYIAHLYDREPSLYESAKEILWPMRKNHLPHV